MWADFFYKDTIKEKLRKKRTWNYTWQDNNTYWDFNKERFKKDNTSSQSNSSHTEKNNNESNGNENDFSSFNRWKDTINEDQKQLKQPEDASIKMIKDVIHTKIIKKEAEINIDKSEVLGLIDKNISELEKEIPVYQSVWNKNLISAIEEKILSYKENKSIIEKWLVPQDKLNKLYNVFLNDIVKKWSSETKESEYKNFAKKISLFNVSLIWNEIKQQQTTELKKEMSDKSAVDKAITQMQKNLWVQINDLKKAASELKMRGKDWDLEKAEEMLKHAYQYETLLNDLNEDKLSDQQKRWLILFSQNDEERHKFLTERLENIKYNTQYITDYVNWIKNTPFSDIEEWIYWNIFYKMLNEESIQLFERFSVQRSLIPWMWDVLPTDDLEVIFDRIKNHLSEDEIKEFEELVKIKDAIFTFDSIKDNLTEEFITDSFREKEFWLENQLNEITKFRDYELKKIDLLNISEEEKNQQKKIIIDWYNQKEAEIRKDQARINKEIQHIREQSSKYSLNNDLINKYSWNLLIYSLTSDIDRYGWVLEAISKETIEWRWIASNLEIDISNIKDYSLISNRIKDLKSLKKELIKNKYEDILAKKEQVKDILLWKVWETTLERQERYKKIDNYLTSSVSWVWSNLILFTYRTFENIVNGIESLPVVISKIKDSIQEYRIHIFAFSFFLISILVFSYIPDTNIASLVEVNTKLYSFSNYILNWDWTMSFVDDKVKLFFIKWSLLLFLTSLIVMYSIIIEIMSRYIEYVRNVNDKTSLDKMFFSIWKTMLFFVFMWLIFKLFL